ncbi:MAG TPA: hypothetical protein VN647_05595 [Nitrospira sp.]|nr:hypothetical protein [Nitrospira sp.]
MSRIGILSAPLSYNRQQPEWLGRPALLSLSWVIESRRKEYYDALPPPHATFKIWWTKKYSLLPAAAGAHITRDERSRVLELVANLRE